VNDKRVFWGLGINQLNVEGREQCFRIKYGWEGMAPLIHICGGGVVKRDSIFS